MGQTRFVDQSLFTANAFSWFSSLAVEQANPRPGVSERIVDLMPALWDPAGQGGRPPDPRRQLRFVELVVLVDVKVAHVLVRGLAGGKRTQ
jgi:hypothetical protein